VKSRDDNQLLGRSQQNFNATSDCDGPFKGQNYTWYAPCGAIANSLFNGKHGLGFFVHQDLQ